ncbi:HD domain-containing phosphohydrolase [Bacterioplanoides sp.]|uniref:HD domain-containing phosphohydrolase n=1 Tax=Bacterioplanoides sp. TaxID=2066072 RepID=UPI003B5C69C2
MAEAISLYWCGLSEQASDCLQALAAEQGFARSAETEAQLCIYGRHAPTDAIQSADLAVVIAEQSSPFADSPAIDFLLPIDAPVPVLRQIINQAIRQLQLKRDNERFQSRVLLQQEQFQRLMDIGLALSAELDHQKLLERILAEARRFGQCDAASIFLIDRSQAEPELVFKLTQNDSLAVDFKEQHFPLDESSLAGHCALSEEILNFEDVYQLDPGSGFHFNQDFDRKTGYRTRSMLVIPMRTHDGKIVGVIQFINRKRANVGVLDPAKAEQQTLAFSASLEALLKAMASQAAVAIENNLLMDRVNQLFEGFVQASVRAIEQRDPTTSGHSFRVAELTTSLAEAASDAVLTEFQTIRFSSAELRELRYAALLHDFGKVGVREHVLVKAKKLTPQEHMRFQYRIALQRETLKNRYLQQRLELSRRGELSSEKEEQLALEEISQLQQLEGMRLAVEEANEPSILDDGTYEHLQQVKELMLQDIDGTQQPLLQDREFLALAVKKGSLTQSERLEIESHVKHTINFLETIPWTPELSGIPKIAGAHHEKLDGSGYPYGLQERDIPVGAKIMTICDIFDALTASDRPYKPALPLSRALDILGYEAADCKIDNNLYALFCQLPHQIILPSLKSI